MEQFFDILSNLEVRLVQNVSPTSNDRTPTAVFQFVSKGRGQFHVQVPADCRCLRFEARYKHRGNFYPHPYTLQARVSPSSVFDHHQQISYDISLYLELKRLQDFEIDDLKRYYEAIDKNLDVQEDLHDFHDVYLILYYDINGQPVEYKCNNNQPIHLPKFISNPWTHTNTVTRFRYDAENRDGIFPCEMTLHHGNVANLQSYRIVLCLTSNTIPPRMDYHAIRWLCKLKPKLLKQNGPSTRITDKEKSYCLNHSSGIVVAEVVGPDLIFTPQMLYPINTPNYVKSCYEPEGFRTDFQNSDIKDNGALAIVVIKGADYPDHMKNRRKDKTIVRYLPFNELNDVDNNLETSNEKIVKRLKTHREQCGKQLILYDENEKGTYSQAHVRLYVAAYDENDILLTEALHPPLRNNKTFEQLRIIKIVQPKCELRANETAYVYCDYDYSKSKPEHDGCPYEFEVVFARLMNTSDENQLLQSFNESHIFTKASYVPNCPCLLQFQVPNDPRYDKHRVFIRLRHTKSKDYNPSAIALNDNECWIYHADPTSIIDMTATDLFNNASRSDVTNSYENIELKIQTSDQYFSLEDITYDPGNSNQDINNSNGSLRTPELDSTTERRFSYDIASSRHD